MQQSEPFDPFLGTDEITESFPSNVYGADQQKSDPYALHEGDRDALKKDFRSIDKDHDGYISFVEFSSYLSKQGMNSQLADTLFPMCDESMDGFFDEDEFVRAAHIAKVSQGGEPLPFAIPESLRDLSKVAKRQDAMPAQDLQISMDMDMIPSFGTESITDPQSFGISTTDANPFSMESADSNPFAMELTTDTNSFATEPAVNTNPFAEGLEEAEEAERQALEALKDPNTVPAIISDNRDKLKTQWKENMQKWRSTECLLRDKADEITAKQDENAKLREQIEALQKALDESQNAVQEKLTRISTLQATLNNHLVKNRLDRPVRVTYDQPDLTDLFSPPEDKSAGDAAQGLSPHAAVGLDVPLSYDVLEEDDSIAAPRSAFNIFAAPLPEDFRTSHERSAVPEQPVANPRAFARSKKAKSFFASEPAKTGATGAAEAISDGESSDEDLKPVMHTAFSAFSRGGKRDVNQMGTSRWYRGAYETKRKMADVIREEEEEKQRLEGERQKAEAEEKKRKAEEKKRKKEEEKRKEEEEYSYSEYSYSEAGEEAAKPVMFVMSDSDDVFSDEDLPAEKPAAAVEEKPAAVDGEKPAAVAGEEKPAAGAGEEKPADDGEEKPADDGEEKPAAGAEEEKPVEEAKEEEKPAEEVKEEEKKEEKEEEFIDDFADEEDLPDEKEEKKEEKPEDDEFNDDFADEETAEKKEDGEKKEKKPKEAKKDKAKKKEKKTTPKVEEKNERRGRRGKKEADKKQGGGALGELGPAKPKKKKKKPAAK